MALLGLPAVPSDLRAVQPYLQRAEELKSKDPVMAYWCAYYAAQIGISVKSKDAGARNLLLALLTKLEHMKQDCGPTDAIDQELASSAYVENFALKVFALADNEDRRGEASRSTAKKFLAAANFLEVLKTFPKSDVSDNNDEKIRYAKWKAADIAKAFREGRDPAPGPAGSQGLPEETPDFLNDLTLPTSPSNTLDIPAAGGSIASSSSSTVSGGGSPPTSKLSGSRHRRRSSASPPKNLDGDIAPNPDVLPMTPPRKSGSKPAFNIVDNLRATGTWGAGPDPNSPGSWSTNATPGNATPGSNDFPTPNHFAPIDYGSPSDRPKRRQDERAERQTGSDDSDRSDSSQKPKPVLKYQSNGNANAEALGLNGNGSRSVRWTPSVEGGLSSIGVPSAPVSPEHEQFPPHPSSGLPPGFIPIPQPQFHPPPQAFSAASPPRIYGPPAPNNNSPPQIYAPSAPPPTSNNSPPQIYANTPPQPPPSQPPPSQPPQIYAPGPAPSAPPAPLSAVPSQIYAVTPSPPNIYHHAPSAAPMEIELTPSVIAKAQKHCRFAISSLDYEDAEQARRELRAALAVLGG